MQIGRIHRLTIDRTSPYKDSCTVNNHPTNYPTLGLGDVDACVKCEIRTVYSFLNFLIDVSLKMFLNKTSNVFCLTRIF